MVNPRVAGLCIKGMGTGGFYSLLENLDGNHMGIGQKLLFSYCYDIWENYQVLTHSHILSCMLRHVAVCLFA